MSIEYTWKLTSITKANSPELTGVVIGTRWECTGTDQDGNSGTFSGATPFNLAEAGGENFVPFDQLTEEVVIGWIQAVVVGGYKDRVEEQILKQIEAKKQDVSVLNDGQFPWSPPAPPAPEADAVPQNVDSAEAPQA